MLYGDPSLRLRASEEDVVGADRRHTPQCHTASGAGGTGGCPGTPTAATTNPTTPTVPTTVALTTAAATTAAAAAGVTYVLGSLGSASCPGASLPADTAAGCKAAAAQMGLRHTVLTSTAMPAGCAWLKREPRLYFNEHPTGTVLQGMKPVCR